MSIRPLPERPGMGIRPLRVDVTDDIAGAMYDEEIPGFFDGH